MGWPLILSLAGTAAGEVSDAHAGRVQREHAEEIARKEQAARNRLMDLQARTDEQRQMASMFNTPQPAGIGRPQIRPDETEEPAYLQKLNQIIGLTQLAQGMGNYYQENPDAAQSVGDNLWDSWNRLRTSRQRRDAAGMDAAGGGWA
jgi:hypothetical protein